MGNFIYSKKTRKEAAQEYLMSGLTLREIAVKYGVTGETIRRWVIEFQKELDFSNKSQKSLLEKN